MTEQEKINLGLCTVQTDSITGKVLIILYLDEEVARLQEEETVNDTE